MGKLTTLKVKSLQEPGRYGDGSGLYLVIRPGGSKSWVQRIVIDGKRCDIGLGGIPAVTLASAREKALDNRSTIADGRDPRIERRRSAVPTFKDAAVKYIKQNAGRWRHDKTAINWAGCLSQYAYPVFGDLRVDRIERSDVLAVLDPVWTTKPAIARKLRQRIRAVFADAMARGHIEINPAGELINAALKPMPAVKSHFRALPYQDVAQALATIEESAASRTAKLCFRFLVLTAARSGEARGATWDEIDMNSKTWTIPANRMKAEREHRVPLSTQAGVVLQEAWLLRDGGELVFPSLQRPGRMLSDMTLTKILKTNGLAARATVHGFRTSFKTWTMETTDTPWAVAEAALAHTLGNSTESAYAQSDLFKRRRPLMQQWAYYVTENAEGVAAKE